MMFTMVSMENGTAYAKFRQEVKSDFRHIPAVTAAKDSCSKY